MKRRPTSTSAPGLMAVLRLYAHDRPGDSALTRACAELERFRRLLRAAERVEITRCAAAIADPPRARQIRKDLVQRHVRLREVAHEIREAARGGR